MRYTKHSWLEGCVYKVQDVKKPYSGEFRCNRILVAVPNMDGIKPFSNQPGVSFGKKYLLFQTLDILPQELEKVTARVLRQLKKMGFTKIEEVSQYEDRMMELRIPTKNPSYYREIS